MGDLNNITNDINSTLISNESELSKFSPGLLTFAALVTGCIMVVGLSGNLLTVVALLKCPKVRNVAAAFIISLCIADFLFCAMVLPFAISGFWTRTWAHGDALCKLVPFLRYGNVGVSLLSIALITLNRYIMIAHHSWYARVYTKFHIALMIMFSWMFSYGMQLPTLIGIWGKFDFDPELGTCSIVPDANGRSAKTALFVIAFIVPALLILICYARIFWVVHSSEQRMREHQRSQNTGPVALNNSEKRSTLKDSRDTKARRNEWRITKMVLAIFLSFLVCYLPITIAKVADSHVHYPIFHILGYLLLYASACVNPIIYVIMNAQYRAAYAAALCCPKALAALTSGGYPSSKDKNKTPERTSCDAPTHKPYLHRPEEMERASCGQLQQHKNRAQSSVVGRVQGGSQSLHGSGRNLDLEPRHSTLALCPKQCPKVLNTGSLGNILQTPDPVGTNQTNPGLTGSLHNLGPRNTNQNHSSLKRNVTGSVNNVGPKRPPRHPGPRIRFQIGSYDVNTKTFKIKPDV